VEEGECLKSFGSSVLMVIMVLRLSVVLLL
jgi:hypothetical protein